jgi:flagellar hook-associated protein FlgK
VRSVDEQHARGVTENGGFDVVRGTRGAALVDVPLVRSGLPFPIRSGEITLTITDPATGNRESHRVAVDPFADSLTDLTSRLNAIPGVSAFLNEQTGRLTLSGDGNQKIDFAGRVDNVPDLSSFSGSSRPKFSGTYNGPANDEWTVSFNQAGTIGVTDGLMADIRNSQGQLVASVEVGRGYEAGTGLAIGDGVSVSLESGTVAATDTASVLVTADSDSTGLLAALGLNSLFTGDKIGGYAVRDDILEHPELLAISTTGFPGESANAAAMADLRDVRMMNLDDRTFIEELADFTAETGLDAQHAQNQKQQLESYGRRLDAQRAATSGVNTDEEFLHMLEVERAYQAAARFISSADEMLKEVFRILP